MLVPVEQVAGVDGQAAYGDRNANLDQVNVGVRGGDFLGKELEAQFFHLVNVPDGAVGSYANGAQGLVDVALHLAPVGAEGWVVNVVQHNEPGFGHRHNQVPPVLAGDVATFRPVGADDAGDGITDGRGKRPENTLYFGEHKTFVLGAHVKPFNSVADAGRVNFAQGGHSLFANGLVHG